MRRPIARLLTGGLATIAAGAVLPLVSPVPAAADRVVVGGEPAPAAETPWVVALSSRERFGDTRAGQFCGGVVVAPTKVLTAAHCMGRDVLGVKPEDVTDLRVIAGRERLTGKGGREVRVGSVRIDPAYDPGPTPRTWRYSRWRGRCPRGTPSGRPIRAGRPRLRAPRRRSTAGATPPARANTPPRSAPPL